MNLRFLREHEALDALPAVLAMYSEIYVEPPYNEGPDDFDDFAASWPARCERPGHRLVIVYIDGEPAGFAFGYLLPADTHWWNGVLAPVDVDVVTEWPGRTFAINEIAVRAAHRRQGTGRILHEALVGDVDVERVTLLSRPEAEAAQAAYRAWGYRRIAPHRPYDEAPVYDVMLLDLPATLLGLGSD